MGMTMQNKRLSKRQHMLLDELFAGNLSEQEVLEKYKIKRNVFANWLNEPAFLRALQNRITAAYQQSAVMLARFAPTAASRLIALTASEKPETARRACLDIIEMGEANKKEQADDKEAMDKGRRMSDDGRGMKDDKAALSDSQASRILAVLTNESEKVHHS
jgi:hypothetical protein